MAVISATPRTYTSLHSPLQTIGCYTIPVSSTLELLALLTVHCLFFESLQGCQFSSVPLRLYYSGPLKDIESQDNDHCSNEGHPHPVHSLIVQRFAVNKDLVLWFLLLVCGIIGCMILSGRLRYVRSLVLRLTQKCVYPKNSRFKR